MDESPNKKSSLGKPESHFKMTAEYVFLVGSTYDAQSSSTQCFIDIYPSIFSVSDYNNHKLLAQKDTNG